MGEEAVLFNRDQNFQIKEGIEVGRVRYMRKDEFILEILIFRNEGFTE